MIRALTAVASSPAIRSLYRIRVGDFRIVYQVKDQELIVLITRVGHRREVYEEIKRLR